MKRSATTQETLKPDRTYFSANTVEAVMFRLELCVGGSSVYNLTSQREKTGADNEATGVEMETFEIEIKLLCMLQ